MIKVELTGQFQGGRQLVRTLELLPYDVPSASGCVPDGFVTDLESFPWYSRTLLPRLGKAARASIVHDYFVKRGLWKLGNQVMYEIMTQDGLTDGRRDIIFYSLEFRRLAFRMEGKPA